MTPSHHLFDLIRSMTMSEKRHFKIFASRHVIGKQNVYIKLFDAIERQSQGSSGEYDETAIKKKFAGENFIRGLPPLKNYLYDIILQSLRVYHGNETVSLQLKKWLDYVEILCMKGQYAYANKILEKVKKTAGQHENLLFALEAVSWQRNIVSIKQPGVFKKPGVNEEIALINDYKNLIFLRDKEMQLVNLLEKKGTARNREETKNYQWIVRDVMEQKRMLMSSLNASLIFHGIMAVYYYAVGKQKESAMNIRKSILLLESHPEILKEKLLKYKSLINNYLLVSLESGNYTEAEIYLKKMKAIPSAFSGSISKELELEIFCSTNTYETNYLIETVQSEQFDRLIREIKEGLLKFGKRISTAYEITFLYNIGCMHYINNDKRAALKSFNKIMDIKADILQDVQSAARMTILVIHYELNNDEIVPYIRKSIRRYMEESDKIYPLETHLLDFFKDLGKLKEKISVEKRFRKLRSDLLKLKEDPAEKRVFGNYFDFISWLDSKIEDRSFKEIIQEKAKENTQLPGKTAR